MTKVARATKNNDFESLCQLILEECQMINNKIEDHSQETNNKVDSNHEIIIQQLWKVEEALEKIWFNEFDIKNIKEELNIIKNALSNKQCQINTLQNDMT